MEIYKYTSLNSAIAILKSGGVVLNNPKNFNDPNDSSFVQSENDKRRIEKLENDYFVYKVFDELTSINKLSLNKTSQRILCGLQKEMKAIKWFLKKRPYFDRICGFNLITKIIETKEPEVESRLNEEKEKFQLKIDSAIEITKENALVSCFSKRNDSILMWSHYANSHRGVCIEYERPESDEFKDVVYSKKRPFAKIYKAVSHAIGLEILGKKVTSLELNRDLEDILNQFFIKSVDWSYEKEVRFLSNKEKLGENVRFSNGKYILNLGYPKRIYIGCKAIGQELNQLIEMAKRRDIEVVFMKKSLNTFDIVEDNNYEYVPRLPRFEHEITLERLIGDINKCIDNKLFLSAFVTSLVVPGICSQVECSEIIDAKERYIKWCEDYLPCTDQTPSKEGMPTITGKMLWDIKEKLLSVGNTDIYKNASVALPHITYRIEGRKVFNIYFETLTKDSITLNITKFCHDMVFQAERCYEAHKKEIYKLPQIPLQDFDALIDKFTEDVEEMAAIKRRLKLNERQ